MNQKIEFYKGENNMIDAFLITAFSITLIVLLSLFIVLAISYSEYGKKRDMNLMITIGSIAIIMIIVIVGYQIFKP